uniref:Uncharacterized protein n=1 Tax=Romanomermis culicivorax TaxID=13658 RepID=A0A915IWZ8_ROMCU
MNNLGRLMRQSCRSDITQEYLDANDLQSFFAILKRVTLTYKDVVMMCWFKELHTGLNNGLKLLMNIHQEEYCTPFNAYDGIGLLFGYKDHNAPFLFNYEKGFRHLPECVKRNLFNIYFLNNFNIMDEM